MGRSNVAAGANAYFDLDMQLVSDDGVTQVLRTVIYLTSNRVVDSVNNLTVWGAGFNRSGSVGLNGAYSHSIIWYQDIAFSRAIGQDQTIYVAATWDAVEYWGVSLRADASHVVPARYVEPSAPGTGVNHITTTTAQIIVSPSADGGGAGIKDYEGFVLLNNAWPYQGGNIVAGSNGGTFVAERLRPSTLYYYTARALNWAGLYSAWMAMKTFWTSPGVPGLKVDSITPSSARIVVSAHSNGGGAGVSHYEAYVMTNNAWPGQGGNVVASSTGGTFVATGLLPSTLYYYTTRSMGVSGIYSAWAAMKVFTTLPSANIKVNGVWKNAIPYVKVDGVWKMAVPFKKRGGVWKQ